MALRMSDKLNKIQFQLIQLLQWQKMYDVHIKAGPLGHQSKNNYVVTVYVMANRLLGYSIYIVQIGQRWFNLIKYFCVFNVTVWSFGL